MATIRQIVPSGAISEFRPIRQEGGNGFRLLAKAMDTAYEAMLPGAIKEATERGDALGREMAGQQIGAPAPVAPADPNAKLAADAMASLGKSDDAALSLIRGFEGFRETPYWDVNALRTGYGSDTVTLADGSVQAVTEGTRVSREDADRDLKRRVSTEFEPIARSAVGDEVWAKMTAGQKAVLSSIAYNYGEIPGRITDAVRSGDPQAGAAAIAALGGDNGGVNKSRRAQEAEIFAGGSLPASIPGQPAYTPPTMIRTADGKLEARLFGPTSNPIMAAHDAAAGASWQADVFLKASQDFMAMSEQFALDPEGFKQATDEYVTAMVENAPDDFKMDVRANLEKEADRRFLGMVDEKHRDIRDRANNSTAALVDKWSDDLAAAIATGNPDEIAAAESELASVLAVRERLPGLSWTPEQSANVMDAATKEGQRRIKAAQDEQISTMKSSLNTIIDAAKKGMTAADEAILDNPMVQQLLPELWREATAFTTLRDEIPTFNTMPPPQQAAALVEMKNQPVQEDWEVDLYGAAEKVAAANAKAWRVDPIRRAGEVLTDEPPPPIPELDPNNPDAFMAALGTRAEYARRLMDEGYTTREVYVSKEEAKTLGAIFGKDVPPKMKALAAGAIVGAMGEDAAGFFAQIKTDDPVIPHVGALLAMGGDMTVATEAMTGQAYLDQQVIPAPSAKSVAAGRASIEAAFMAVPGAAENMDGVAATAKAIYAARVPANADEETQAEIMQGAWQSALGQNDDLGVLRGGVQDVGGQQVLLPPTMAGEDLNDAMQSAFGYHWAEGWGSSVANAFAGPQTKGIDQAMWMAAAGGIPALGGEPIDPSLWENGEIIMTPIRRPGKSGSEYVLTATRNGGVVEIGVLGQSDDVPFIFDAEALVEASLVPK